MKYSIGQIYFINDTESLFGKAITYYNKKKFGQSDTTHVGIICEVSNDFITIAEATNGGFKISPYEKWWIDVRVKDGRIKIGECNESIKNVLKNCKKYDGIGYGWLDILMIGIGFLTGFKIGLTGKNKIICSEAVCRVLYDCSKTIDFQAEYGIPFDLITPQHIFLSKQISILK